MTDLEWAKSEIASPTNIDTTAKALQILADASARFESRPSLQENTFFQQLLDSFVHAVDHFEAASTVRNALRCVGNLVADNEPNRSTLISDIKATEALENLLTSESAAPDATILAHTAIKVLFNLCNDYKPAQQECFTRKSHESLIECLDTRPPTDEGVWGLALDLLVLIVDHKRELQPSEDYTEKIFFVSRLLRLPLASIDPTAFFDCLTVVTAYLQDEKFVLAIVEHKQMDRVWEILRRIEQRSHADREIEDEDYDEKQYLQFQLVFSQSLADMSSLSLYTEKYGPSDAFVQSLMSESVPSSTDTRSRSPLPPTACLVLGNLITSDETASTLVSHVPISELFSSIGQSDDTAFLNAASGLLRHLATPMQNRENYFADPAYVQSTQHLYTDITLEQVQVGGLALTRQLLMGMKSRVISLLSQASSEFLSKLLTTYQTTTSTAVKLEMSRLFVTLFRTLQPESAPSSTISDVQETEAEATKALLDTPVNLPSALDPLVFSINHTPEPSITAIQAEAWLGLNLLARISGGPRIVADALLDDEALFSLLCSRLGGDVGGFQLIDGEEKSKDPRPQWLKEKERDNALVLTSDLLKAEDVDTVIKDRLRRALDERNIRMG